MTDNTANLNTLWANLIVEELSRHRIGMFCLSPGSRSTPLVLAVARNEEISRVIHFDERSTAYYAVGYGRATGKPAVLICTSGTAAANYWPAIVEASMDRIPLVVLTSDRPPELHECGANQTIEQTKLYGEYVRWHTDLPCADEYIDPAYLLSTVDQAVYRSLRSPAGPVHINCRFREPLIPTDYNQKVDYPESINSWVNSDKPHTAYSHPLTSVDNDTIRSLSEQLNAADTGLIIAGRLNQMHNRTTVIDLARALGWPLLTDILSGLALGSNTDQQIPYFEFLLDKFVPSNDNLTLLQLGDTPVTKKLQEFLAKNRPYKYIHIADYPDRQDPMHLVTMRVESDFTELSQRLVPLLHSKTNKPWFDRWKKPSVQIEKLWETELGKSGKLTEPQVSRLITKHIVGDTCFFVGNSRPIRGLGLFADPSGPAIPIGCNRGASGIDGTIAAGLGFASGLNKNVTILSGDLAFLHDLNSLAHTQTFAGSVVIVVINNNGGGIFSFLPQHEHIDVFEKYFGTPHGFHFDQTAAMFGCEYNRPETSDEFVVAYQTAQKKNKFTIIEVVTDREENLQYHQQLYQKVQNLLEGK